MMRKNLSVKERLTRHQIKRGENGDLSVGVSQNLCDVFIVYFTKVDLLFAHLEYLGFYDDRVEFLGNFN